MILCRRGLSNFIPYGMLRLHPKDEADLCWFWDDARGDLGLRAQSYEPKIGGHDVFVDLHNSETGSPHEDRRMLAVERYGKIERTLDRMIREHIRVLQRWCGNHKSPPELLVTFGPFCGIAPRTQTARSLRAVGFFDGLTRLCLDLGAQVVVPIDQDLRDAAKVAAHTRRTEARQVVATIRAEAQALLSAAVSEYNLSKPIRRIRAA